MKNVRHEAIKSAALQARTDSFVAIVICCSSASANSPVIVARKQMDVRGHEMISELASGHS